MNDQSNKKILVAYASQFGSTHGVAEAVSEVLSDQGYVVETKWVKNVTEVKGYDAVIIGGAIQYDRWMADASEFTLAHQEALSKLPVAYFFTCLTLSKRTAKTERQALGYADKLAALAPQVRPIAIGRFAGVLNYRKMPFHFRFMFRIISLITGVQEGDYREWNLIQTWTEETHFKLFEESVPLATA